MRYAILDGFRGYFLLFMMIVHVNAELDTVLGRINHHAVGWVEDAQGFVFISGLVVGIVYAKILLRKGAGAMTRALFQRIRTIYSHQAGLILLAVAAATALAHFGIRPAILAPFWDTPVSATLASLGLVFGSTYMDILPMYLWFMVLTPLVLVLLHRGWGPVLIAVSALLWILAQTPLAELPLARAESAFAAAGYKVRLGFLFTLPGWQVLFFSGLYLGYLHAEDRLDLSVLHRPWLRHVATAGFVLLLGLAFLDLAAVHRLVSLDFTRAVYAHVSRSDLSALYVVAFYLDLFLIAWLVVAGRAGRPGPYRAMGRGLHYLFTRRPLVFLGQHSLHVFSYHVILAYALAVIVGGRDLPELAATAILLASTASLYLPAWAHARVQRRSRDPARHTGPSETEPPHSARPPGAKPSS